MLYTNVTAKVIADVTGLNKTDASAFVRLMVKQGHATEMGNRKNLVASGDAFIIVRGRPSITFDVDSAALVGYIGADKATKVADMAAKEHAAYTANLAHAEESAKVRRDAATKDAKVRGLQAKLAALSAGNPDGTVF